ncbi:MAG: hypothetical protein AAF393_02200 [Pseudomonadota bacterium]
MIRALFSFCFFNFIGATGVAASACGQIYGDADAVAGKFFELGEVAKAPECKVSASVLTCIWDFGLGEDAATQTYETLAGQLRACGEDVSADAPVSHPDKSQGWNGSWDGFQVRVSKKDKNGLSKTYVFVERRPL